MATSPSRQDVLGAPPPTPASLRKRPTGRWLDGAWWCDCDPARKAILRKIKKKTSPNVGKFFWGCEATSCDFFLLDNLTEARETGPASSSKAAEEPQQPKTSPFAQRKLTSFGYTVTRRQRKDEKPAIAAESDPESTSSGEDEMSQEVRKAIMEPAASQLTPAKRKQDDMEKDFFDDLDSEEEREMMVAADTAELEQDVTVQRSAYFTPETTRSVDVFGGLPTPAVARTLFPDVSAKRQKTVSFEEPVTDTASSSEATPGRERTHELPPSSPPEAGNDLTQDVMNLLKGQNVKPQVLGKIREVLDASVRKTKGVTLGRDTARAALEDRNERIAQLQDRVTALENNNKMLNGQLTNVKAKLMRTYKEI